MRPHGLLVVAALALAACSPTLNWREVPIEGLIARLPCKPDRAQRTVRLGETDLPLEMAGCEAGGGLFAISRVPVADATQSAAILAAWQKETLRNMAAATVQEREFQSGAATGMRWTHAVMVAALGQRPDGRAVQAQLAWITTSAGIFHVAVYAPRLNSDMTDILFSELQLQ
ncbi:MAG: hypothetical protein WA136_00770 [Rhodoferax sp.]